MAPEAVDIALKVREVVPIVAVIAARVAPEVQVEVAGRLEGEEGPARAGADRLVGIVEEAALRSAARFNEAEQLRGLCSAQMEVTTLAGTLLRKAGAAKLKAEEAKTQLAKLNKKSASWKSAHSNLQAVKMELEDTRRQKELEGERAKALEERESLQKELEAESDKATAERETLKKELEAERAKAAFEAATLQKELDEERAKAASERAAYPNLYVAAVDQFKGSAKFQLK
ncbi:uncharacterized protein LOC114294622 [Camellia sinensis]|uniref:uncharacterized protein LOC114294622 n=1 Tax=Camellia sinensis TaxID=4442 RepID=UPI001035F91A|nr:uncharacterized protein LOC114294622 [Camellia sinensis]